MNLRERTYYAREEFIKQSEPYHRALGHIEIMRQPKYLYDTTTQKMTRVEDKPTVYEIWLRIRIEEIRVSTNKLFNIMELTHLDYESKIM